MWQGMDRRKFPRVNYPCKIIVAKKQHKDKFSTQTENIGAGGVCVVLEKELPRFSEVEIILYLENNQPEIHCLARVVWVVKRGSLEKYKPNQFDTGLEFIDIQEKDKNKIDKVVKECLEKEETS